jgi:hypothetical protein
VSESLSSICRPHEAEAIPDIFLFTEKVPIPPSWFKGGSQSAIRALAVGVGPEEPGHSYVAKLANHHGRRT